METLLFLLGVSVLSFLISIVLFGFKFSVKDNIFEFHWGLSYYLSKRRRS